MDLEKDLKSREKSSDGNEEQHMISQQEVDLGLMGLLERQNVSSEAATCPCCPPANKSHIMVFLAQICIIKYSYVLHVHGNGRMMSRR